MKYRVLHNTVWFTFSALLHLEPIQQDCLHMEIFSNREKIEKGLAKLQCRIKDKNSFDFYEQDSCSYSLNRGNIVKSYCLN